MSSLQVIATYIISNTAALFFLAIAVYSNRLARILFSVLFIGAGFLNWTVVRSSPSSYLNYSKYAVGFYRDIIVGPFQNHIVPIVTFIAICQVVIGLGLLYKECLLKISCIAGSVFLVAISPLGIGSAFPSGLIWAIGLFVIYKYPTDKSIFNTISSFKNAY
jgi:hypothetical protein